MVAGARGSFHKAGSTKMTNTNTRTAGIDTSKHRLDVAFDEGQPAGFQVTNDAPGWRRLAKALTDAAVERIGIEATGGYEQGVVGHLRKAGFTVLVLQPMQVKAYARVHLRRAKNDKLDAGMIAACAAVIQRPRVEPDERLARLAGHLTFIEQIEEDLARAKVRLEHVEDARLKRITKADIARFKRRRAAELKRLEAAIRHHDDLARRFDLVLSVDGIAERTALAIIVRMPEIGQVSREEAAALTGLAPFDDDSGGRRGLRHIAGGRERLRRSLYAAAFPAAMQWNQDLVALYDRLTEKGKPHRLALVACARKLIVYANTVVQRGTPWRKQLAST
jgi:transposase